MGSNSAISEHVIIQKQSNEILVQYKECKEKRTGFTILAFKAAGAIASVIIHFIYAFPIVLARFLGTLVYI